MTSAANTNKRFDGRIALITGGSRGIGQSLAVALACEGAHTILIARSVGGLEETDDLIQSVGGTATLVPMDLRDGEALAKLSGAIAERWGRLDSVTFNAGVLGRISPLTHLEPKIWEELLAVNLTANWQLLGLIDPLLKASDAGRALFVSSNAAAAPRAFWGGYTVTKTALETLALTYAEECASTNVKVNVVRPHGTRTRMRATAKPGEDPETVPAPGTIIPVFLDLLDPKTAPSGEVVHADGTAA